MFRLLPQNFWFELTRSLYVQYDTYIHVHVCMDVYVTYKTCNLQFCNFGDFRALISNHNPYHCTVPGTGTGYRTYPVRVPYPVGKHRLALLYTVLYSINNIYASLASTPYSTRVQCTVLQRYRFVTYLY